MLEYLACSLALHYHSWQHFLTSSSKTFLVILDLYQLTSNLLLASLLKIVKIILCIAVCIPVISRNIKFGNLRIAFLNPSWTFVKLVLLGYSNKIPGQLRSYFVFLVTDTYNHLALNKELGDNLGRSDLVSWQEWRIEVKLPWNVHPSCSLRWRIPGCPSYKPILQISDLFNLPQSYTVIVYNFLLHIFYWLCFTG